MQNTFGFLRRGAPPAPRGILPVPNYTPAPTGGGGIGGGDLLSTNNLSDVANAATARANLGIVSLLSLPPTLFGDGIANTFVIPHGMGTANIIPHVKKVSNGVTQYCSITHDATNITINIEGTPPAVNEFSLIAIGF